MRGIEGGGDKEGSAIELRMTEGYCMGVETRQISRNGQGNFASITFYGKSCQMGIKKQVK